MWVLYIHVISEIRVTKFTVWDATGSVERCLQLFQRWSGISEPRSTLLALILLRRSALFGRWSPPQPAGGLSRKTLSSSGHSVASSDTSCRRERLPHEQHSRSWEHAHNTDRSCRHEHITDSYLINNTDRSYTQTGPHKICTTPGPSHTPQIAPTCTSDKVMHSTLEQVLFY
jgi:hypothetical protein